MTGIEPIKRKRGGQFRVYPELDRVRDLHAFGFSAAAIGRHIGMSSDVVRRLIRRAGQSFKSPKLERHGQWKGGRSMTRDGYVLALLTPDDPFVSMTKDGRYVLEHRLVMARALGRPLEDFETVHHINGDRQDNRPENLQLRSGKHGNGVVAVCAKCGSHELVYKAIQ